MFARDVHDGLSKPGQKELPCKYFYDAVGSALFEAITVLPEYGLTRADSRQIRRLAPELSRRFRGPVAVAELGSGTGSKTRWILEALAAATAVTYHPIDLSVTALAQCERELSAFCPVFPLAATYLDGLSEVVSRRTPGQAMLVLFLGGTIGNFDRAEAQDFLCDVRACLQPGDALLLGADLVKPVETMLAAYDDPVGVTAAFNLNLLARINRELGAAFALRNFAHEARWNEGCARIEMHLRARVAQQVYIPGAGLCCMLRKDETIWTESCHKFRAADLCEMAERAGFDSAEQWIDEEWPFAESLFIA